MIEPVIPLRALEHHSYCPRQAALIHVDGVWADNAHTVRGVVGHRRVDSGESRVERGRRVIRGVTLWSERFGLSGRADVIEVLPDGRVQPVEYKHGVRHGRAAEVQLCAQALCLEEMTGQDIEAGHVWYSGHRRREPVAFDDALRELTASVIAEVRGAFSSPRLPHPADDERCVECQLRAHCLPDLVASPGRINSYIDAEVFACE